MKKQGIHASGKRKTAIARATLKPGTGKVFLNNVDINNYSPRLAKLRIKEPLILAGQDVAGKIDLNINLTGGGVSCRTEAARLAIGRALVMFQPKLKSVFLDYDRHLLVADVRRKESAKPNCRGHARSRRQKSYR